MTATESPVQMRIQHHGHTAFGEWQRAVQLLIAQFQTMKTTRIQPSRSPRRTCA